MNCVIQLMRSKFTAQSVPDRLGVWEIHVQSIPIVDIDDCALNMTGFSGNCESHIQPEASSIVLALPETCLAFQLNHLLTYKVVVVVVVLLEKSTNDNNS